MNAREYALFYNEQAKNDNLAPYFTQDQIDGFKESFDWQDLVFQKAPMKTLSANVSGGNDKTRFSFSGSIFDQGGIIKGSNYKRYSLHTNVQHDISKKLSVSLVSILTRASTETKNSSGGNRGGSMIAAAISAAPTVTPYYPDGTYRVLQTDYSFSSNAIINPLNYINEQSNRINANKILANAALTYKLLPELIIKVSGGIENTDDRTDAYTTSNFINSPGNASVSSNQFISLLNENTITYNKTFNQKHNVSVVAGLTYQDFLSTSLSGSGNGFISDASQTFDLRSAITPGIWVRIFKKCNIITSWAS